MTCDHWSAQFATTAGDVPLTEMQTVDVGRARDVVALLSVMLTAHPEMEERVEQGVVYLSCTAPVYSLMRRSL